jgi:hypothetical protein
MWRIAWVLFRFWKLAQAHGDRRGNAPVNAFADRAELVTSQADGPLSV